MLMEMKKPAYNFFIGTGIFVGGLLFENPVYSQSKSNADDNRNKTEVYEDGSKSW